MSASFQSVFSRSRGPKFLNEVQIGHHTLLADEPVELDGDDAGPRPTELLMAALATCTSMTLRIYARRKQWPLEQVDVDVTHDTIRAESLPEDQRKNLEGRIDRFHRAIRISGPLDESQTARLLEIANKCPVHKMITRGVIVESSIAVPSVSAV